MNLTPARGKAFDRATHRAPRARVAVCASQVPFVRGGAELMVEALVEELRRRGYDAELIQLPGHWSTREQVLRNCLAWRLLDLETAVEAPIDLVIATRFPAYLVRHPHKVVWLIHQLRQVYDQLGTPYSDFQPSDPRDRRVMAAVRGMDRRCLTEARALFTIADNTTDRLARFNGIEASTLYHPPHHGGRYRCDAYEPFFLAVGRLDAAKRFDLAIRALARCREPARLVVAGTGPQREELAALAERLGVVERVELLGWVEDELLLDLYARCRGVIYVPYDEDYGYVTLEAFLARKPVITCADSGGVLEFVQAVGAPRGGEANGFVGDARRPRTLAAALDVLTRDEDLARRLGEAGHRRVADIHWDQVVEALTATLGERAWRAGEGSR